ncbi:MAG: hypothetical protein U0M58_04865 [Blautia sp.]|nr:hypothetical protein [Blautia sp.]
MSLPHKKGLNTGETFVVNIKCRQNHTWQGTVKWIEGQKEIPFRSTLELIKLMESAIEIADEVESIEEPTW